MSIKAATVVAILGVFAALVISQLMNFRIITFDPKIPIASGGVGGLVFGNDCLKSNRASLRRVCIRQGN